MLDFFFKLFSDVVFFLQVTHSKQLIFRLGGTAKRVVSAEMSEAIMDFVFFN